MLDAAGNFGIKESPIPEFCNCCAFCGGDPWHVNIALRVGDKVFFCCAPCVPVNSFKGSRVVTFGEVAYVLLEVAKGVGTIVRPVYMFVWGGIDCVKGVISVASFGGLPSKGVRPVISAEARVTADLEQCGRCMEACPLHDTVADKLKNGSMAVENVFSWRKKLFVYLEKAAKTVAKDGNWLI
jgi:hypothetical protein